MAFGNSWHGLVGNPFQHFGLSGLLGDAAFGAKGDTIPALAFVAFQAVFAIITVALISGAIADRAKFATWMVFAVVWATIVYFPVAHWVFAFDGYAADKGGWIANQLKAIDFAGGTAVHINAGAAGLALALVLGKRVGFGKEPMRPHNLTLVMIGAGLLWFGWFGFNAGSALGANGTAAIAWVNTLVATGAAMLGWLAHREDPRRPRHLARRGLRCRRRPGRHHPGLLPRSRPVGAIVLGVVAGVLCALAVGLKFRFGFDDSLDVVGVHLVGGLVGTLAIGFLGHRRRRRPASTACSTVAGSTSCGARPSARSRSSPSPSSSPSSSAGAASRRPSGFRIDRGRRGRAASTCTSTLRRRTTSARSVGGRLGAVALRAPPAGRTGHEHDHGGASA